MADRAREKGRTNRYYRKPPGPDVQRGTSGNRRKEEGCLKGKPVNRQVKNTKAAAEARRRATAYKGGKS